jgi:hypothetical protein
MKKLFADPHFNVMDRLDTYIDDYTVPDPIPAAMLRSMNGAKLLGLFDDEEGAEAARREKDPAPRLLGDDADGEPAGAVAQSYATPDIPPAPAHGSQPAAPSAQQASQDHDAHTDLRLQPDDAPAAPRPGRSAA